MAVKEEKKEKKEKKERKEKKPQEEIPDEEREHTETFNGLPAKFQWTPDLDEDYIFPEERELIAKLRQHFGEDLRDWSDKMVMYFLFSRREDLELTKLVIERYLKLLKDHDLVGKRIRMSDMPTIGRGEFTFFVGNYDKHDRLIYYFYPSRGDPKASDKLINTVKMLVFDVQLTTEVIPLRYLRNGCIEVIDLKGFGLKHLDTSNEMKEISNLISGTFPRRIRVFIPVHGGLIVKMAMKFAKLILPRKLMSRFVTGDIDQLKELVSEDQLLVDFGGKLNKTQEDSMKYMMEYDRKFGGVEPEPKIEKVQQVQPKKEEKLDSLD